MKITREEDVSEADVHQPQAAVIIPTYNQAESLRNSLESLACQRFPIEEFEVIVADDGSRDSTIDIVKSFSDRLRLQYYFQEDQGLRAAAARNGGARLSCARVLIFMDNGTLAGPDFVCAHVELHTRQSNAVIGYTYGYRPWGDATSLSRALRTISPEEIVERYGHEPWTWDWRHEMLADPALDVNDRPVPWLLFQSMNCSVRASDFWNVGGFDEKICHWGTEDLELGFRLQRQGIPFVVGHRAWAMELHDRDMRFRLDDVKPNAWYFLEKHPEPVAEVFWLTLMREHLWEMEADYKYFLEWVEQARNLNVRSEICEATEDLCDKDNHRIAVFGCGSDLPSTLPPCTLVDFDRVLLDNAIAGSPNEGLHAIGLRTPLPDQSQDLVIITSRLSGLWERWGGDLVAEAKRVGRIVRQPPGVAE